MTEVPFEVTIKRPYGERVMNTGQPIICEHGKAVVTVIQSIKIDSKDRITIRGLCRPLRGR